MLSFLTLLNPLVVNREISQMFDDRYENRAEGRLGLLWSRRGNPYECR
jgi:hypothetical protein